jgi:hypothetical protein
MLPNFGILVKKKKLLNCDYPFIYPMLIVVFKSDESNYNIHIDIRYKKSNKSTISLSFQKFGN